MSLLVRSFVLLTDERSEAQGAERRREDVAIGSSVLVDEHRQVPDR